MTTVLDGPEEAAPGPAPEEYPLCRRNAHRLTPENRCATERHRCRACKNEYNQVRRSGGTWDGPGGPVRSHGPLRPVPTARLRADRIAVGACPDCGWTRDLRTAHGCDAGVGSVDRDTEEA